MHNGFRFPAWRFAALGIAAALAAGLAACDDDETAGSATTAAGATTAHGLTVMAEIGPSQIQASDGSFAVLTVTASGSQPALIFGAKVSVTAVPGTVSTTLEDPGQSGSLDVVVPEGVLSFQLYVHIPANTVPTEGGSVLVRASGQQVSLPFQVVPGRTSGCDAKINMTQACAGYSPNFGTNCEGDLGDCYCVSWESYVGVCTYRCMVNTDCPFGWKCEELIFYWDGSKSPAVCVPLDPGESMRSQAGEIMPVGMGGPCATPCKLGVTMPDGYCYCTSRCAMPSDCPEGWSCGPAEENVTGTPGITTACLPPLDYP